MVHPKETRHRAFTLVEVMITLAVLTVALLGMMEFMTAQQKAQGGVQNASEVTQLNSIMLLIFTVKSACDANLTGLPFDPTQNNTVLQDKNTFGIYYPADDGHGNIIQGTKLIDSAGSFGGWNVSTDANNGGIGIRNMGAAGGGVYFISVEVNLAKKTDSAGHPISFGSPVAKSSAVSITVLTASGKIQQCIFSGLPAQNMALFDGSGTASTSTTFSVPATTAQVRIEAWGGGGGGGAGSGVNRGTGGGGGGYGNGMFAVTGGATLTINLGGGGAGGLSGSANNGYGGGVGGTSSGPGAIGAFESIQGGYGWEASDVNVGLGYGGASPKGGAGGTLSSSGTLPDPPTAPGGGGAGAGITQGKAGGSGMPGRVIIWY